MIQLEQTRRDYDAMSVRYAEFARDPANTSAPARGMVHAFAEVVLGRAGDVSVLDVGCGPGQLTAMLADLGLAARGVDLSPALIGLARQARPDLAFDVGSFFALDFDDDRFDALLAHFSLIHTRPDDVPAALAEWTRVLRPGGVLLVGFQSSDEGIRLWEPFDHKGLTRVPMARRRAGRRARRARCRRDCPARRATGPAEPIPGRISARPAP